VLWAKKAKHIFMKGDNMKKVLIIIFAMLFLLNCCGCARPFGKTINNNKEMAQYLPILREDYSKIKERLEIFRLGVFEGKKYTVFSESKSSSSDDYQISISDGIEYFDFMESLDLFTQEEIDAINYLLFSDELQLNAHSITFGTGVLSLESSAVFAKDGRYLMGIYYFETSEGPEYFRSRGDYAEELGDNYWILFWFMETA